MIDLKTRELCTVAALTVQGFSLVELKLHVKAAVRCGASRAEVTEVITQMDRLLRLSRRDQRPHDHEGGVR